MSPEQAYGKVKETDQRSDILVFGWILFEATTGHKPFEGEDILDSIHKIVHAPTPQIKEINAKAPDELQRIVRRCLAKDPDERYQTIKDVAIELKEVRRSLRPAGIDTTVPPLTGTMSMSALGTEIDAPQIASATMSASAHSLSTRQSSAEYVVTGIKQNKLAVVIVATVIVIGIVVVAAAY